MREWKRDRELGVTDHERRNQLMELAEQIGEMPEKDQRFWEGHLKRILDQDPSPEMRRLAVLAASRLRTPQALPLVERGLGDASLKVKMEACRSLGRRDEPEAARLLASTLGSTGELDVKHAAIAALGNHQGNIPMESLRVVLEDQDPATLDLAMTSLRDVMGEDYGQDPQQWIAAVDEQLQSSPGSQPGEPDEAIRYAERESDSLR
jgi:HEAT repeat protein